MDAWLADWLVDVFLGLALLLAAVAGGLLRGKRYEPPAPEAVTLQKLSDGWIRGGPTIHISELVHFWRNEQLHKEKVDAIPLNHPRAAAFLVQMRKWAFFKKNLQQRVVCEQILQLLDREGDCPSVVSLRGDVEGTWDENTYRILAQTNLLDHSLNVAEQVVRLLSEDQAWHVIPDTMVAALGHDLGKLKSQSGSLYSTGEHPLAASKPLAGISGFKKLPRKEEILRAIRLHHKMPEGLLGKTLKKADQLARQKELEETVQDHIVEATKEDAPASDPPRKTMTETTGPLPETSFSPVIANPAKAAWQAQIDIYGEKPSGQKQPATEPPQLLDISRWFDGAGFLNELKPYINKMFGRLFLAFSMPDGLVYFQVKVLEDVARKQAERASCIEIATMDQKDLAMRHVLFTIVHRLRAEQDIIAGGLIKETYFGGYFLVARKFGKDLKGYYTPFHAEAFGSIAEMEHAKPDLLRDIVKVTPFLDSCEQEI